MTSKLKWLPAVIALLGYLSSMIDPTITTSIAHWASANPDIAATVATLVAAVYHGLDHPLKKAS